LKHVNFEKTSHEFKNRHPIVQIKKLVMYMDRITRPLSFICTYTYCYRFLPNCRSSSAIL